MTNLREFGMEKYIDNRQIPSPDSSENPFLASSFETRKDLTNSWK